MPPEKWRGTPWLHFGSRCGSTAFHPPMTCRSRSFAGGNPTPMSGTITRKKIAVGGGESGEARDLGAVTFFAFFSPSARRESLNTIDEAGYRLVPGIWQEPMFPFSPGARLLRTTRGWLDRQGSPHHDFAERAPRKSFATSKSASSRLRSVISWTRTRIQSSVPLFFLMYCTERLV